MSKQSKEYFNDNDEEAAREASWSEVGAACCIHSLQEWTSIALGILGIGFFLFFFVVGLSILTDATKVIGGCDAGLLFSDDETNPVSGVIIGILTSTLLGSTSAATSIVISLVGADSISIKSGIYIIMGSNVGASVISTIVSLGHMGHVNELERCFSAATVHDMFNIMTLLVLFPIEVTTHYIYNLSLFLIGDDEREGQGEKWTSPLKEAIEPISKMIIVPNKRVAKDVAKGRSCDDYYPVNCTDGIVSYPTCRQAGLITCDKQYGCPAFFQDGATRKDDETAGAVCFVLGLAIIFICSIIIITILQRMLMEVSVGVLYKVTNIDGNLAILLGAGATLFVQSSTIFTSVLLPFAGTGLIRLEQILPLTIGANIGASMTGVLASLVSDGTLALQASLSHVIFNVSGAIIWYPIPFLRQLLLNAARTLGTATRGSRFFPILYIIGFFGVLPRILLFVSDIIFQFDGDARKYTIFGAFIAVVVIIIVLQPRGSESDTSPSYQQVLPYDDIEVLPPPTTDGSGPREQEQRNGAFAEVLNGQEKQDSSVSTPILPVSTPGIRLVGVTLE